MKLFLPQTLLEEWTSSNKADLQEHALVVTGETIQYPIEAAVHVTSLVSGPDEQHLLKKVKTDAQLSELGAERLADSVVAGESAYDVESGYVVQVPDPPAATETSMLADYLLNKI